jgi:hypothetical protein
MKVISNRSHIFNFVIYKRFAGQDLLYKDPTVWLDTTPNKSNYEFGKLVILQARSKQILWCPTWLN